MQRATINRRHRILVATIVAAIATVLAAPGTHTSTQSSSRVAHFLCPPMC